MENTQMEASTIVGGVFSFELVRDGVVIDAWGDHNLVPNEGLNHMLGVLLSAQTQVSTWYVGLFEGNYTPVAGDTMAAFPAAATESTAYSETVRQTYVESAPSSQSVTNSASKATFTINASKTMYGAFLSSNSAKSATSGTLLAATRFATARSVISGDIMLVTYTFTAASA